MRMRGRPRSRASSSRRPRSRDVLRARVTRARDEKTFFLPATTRRSLASTLDASPFARACAVSTSRASDVHPRARRHHTHRHHASHSTHVSLVVYTSHLPSTIVPSPPPPPLESRSVTSTYYIKRHPSTTPHTPHPCAPSPSTTRAPPSSPSTVRMWINPRRMTATTTATGVCDDPMATMFASECASARVFRPRARYASTMTTRERDDPRGCDVDVDVDEMRCDEWRLTMMTSRAMRPFERGAVGRRGRGGAR